MWRSLLAFALIVLAIVSNSIAAQSSATNKRQAKIIAAVRAVLDAQRDAWNRGDIEGYLNGYDRSANTVFVSGDTVTRGWQTVLERYRKSYDTRDKMGTLTFSDLEIEAIGDNAALVLGRWHLKRAKDEPHGRFTLLLRRTRHGWKVVHDHTS